MPIDAATWYDSTPDASQRYQGDILTGVPVVLMPAKGDGPWILLRPSGSVTIERALEGDLPSNFRPHPEASVPTPWPDDQNLVLARGKKSRILVVTQSCDLDHRRWIQVAPVSPASALHASKQASLRTNQINYMFYLPAAPPDLPEECFADLSQITAVHTSYLRDATLVRRMTNLAMLELQKKLASLYGRPFGFNAQDIVPQSADYLCFRCFIRTATIQRVTAQAGANFPSCSGCGDAALWLKLP